MNRSPYETPVRDTCTMAEVESRCLFLVVQLDHHALDRLNLHLEGVSFISWQDCKSVGGTSDHQSIKRTWHSFSARASSLNLNHHQKNKIRLCLWKLTLPIKQHTWCSQHMLFLNRSWLSFYWITSTEGYKVVTVVFVVVLSINLTKCSLC